jgi:microcystin-dependent protein
MTAYLGQICMVSFTMIPLGWAACDGQELQIDQNQALYSVIGTTYGGNGATTFKLPDLCGRVPLNVASNYFLGQSGGEDTHTLSQSEIPMHRHTAAARNAAANSPYPTNNVWPAASSAYASTANTTMNPAVLGNAGGGLAHENRQPYLSIQFIICLTGAYPTRS